MSGWPNPQLHTGELAPYNLVIPAFYTSISQETEDLFRKSVRDDLNNIENL
jgi:hypothetical protein